MLAVKNECVWRTRNLDFVLVLSVVLLILFVVVILTGPCLFNLNFIAKNVTGYFANSSVLRTSENANTAQIVVEKSNTRTTEKRTEPQINTPLRLFKMTDLP